MVIRLIERYQPKKIKLTYVLVILMLIYLFVGTLRFVPIENDGMRIALGIQSNILYGTQKYSYFYDGQAGTYQLIEVIVKILGIKPFDAFSLLTAVSSIVFLFAAAYFLKRITRTSFIVALLSLVLFQEIWVSGYYPNSSMIAAVFLSVALLLTTWKERLPVIALSGFFFALAVWSRFDAIVLGSAFLVLLVEPNVHSMKATSLFGMTFLATSVVIIFSSRVALQTILQEYLGYGAVFANVSLTLNNYSTIFTLATLFFCVFGLYNLLKVKQWRLIMLTCLAPLPLILGYGYGLDSPKKLLFALLLFSIPIAYCFSILSSEIRNKAINTVSIVGIVLITGQYIFTPPYELVLSRSTLVPTADQVRLRGAIAFTPLYWAKEKERMTIVDNEYQRRINEYITKNNQASIIAHDWMANNWIMYHLQSMNYRITQEESVAPFLEDGHHLILRKNQDRVSLVRWQPEKPLELPDTWKEQIRSASSVLYVGPDVVYAGPHDPAILAQNSFLTKEFKCKQWEKSARFWTMECWQ